MGLGALGCPPADRISLRITQLHAAGSPVRFRAMAVASVFRNGPQQSRCVREERGCARQQNRSQEVESGGETPPRDGVVEEPAHRGILPRLQKKTDSSASSKILLPGSWNQVETVRTNLMGGGQFPIQIEARSDLNLECGIGAANCTLLERNTYIIKRLSGVRPNSALAAPVHYRDAWARFK